jgi:hypothetical protein
MAGARLASPQSAAVRGTGGVLMRFAVAIFFAFYATAAAAAPADDVQSATPPRQVTQHKAPDFLFGRPRGALSVRGSWLFARAGSDWYDFVGDQLTLKKHDFNAPAFAADVRIAVTPRLDAVAGIEFSHVSRGSEYRRLVDNNRLPIEQTTRLGQADVTASIKFALTEPGREISSLVWVPRRITPYVTAGGGFMHFDLRQSGDFVDYVDLSVFTDVFRASGWTPTAHMGGGMDVKLTRRLYGTVDGRYRWAAGKLGQDWVNFDEIDLTGFHMSAGINVLF